MTEKELTHKGWMGLCPIYLSFPAEEAGEEGVGAHIEARWWWLEWWLSVQHYLQLACMSMLSWMNPDYEPGFVVTITGRRKNRPAPEERT